MKDNRVWRTSSYSGGQGDCVEVAIMPGNVVAVRDSKDRTGPELVFASRAWAAFIQTVSTHDAPAIHTRAG